MGTRSMVGTKTEVGMKVEIGMDVMWDGVGLEMGIMTMEGAWLG